MDGKRERGRPVADFRIDIISNAEDMYRLSRFIKSVPARRIRLAMLSPRIIQWPTLARRTCAINVDTALLLLNVSY